MSENNGAFSLSEQIYPFVAIVGQEAMKQALLWLAVDPLIGGVLITGTRGTAKSTVARALAGLLPPIEVVAGDPFNRAVVDGRQADTIIPTPFIELPLGAGEDRVIGTLDVQALLRREQRIDPGLLARANRGMLYVDEVNLLPDHLVDVVLDAAATGRNVVERDGLSCTHDARIMLVGTMNPEEGELRPQFLDRFGLCVESRNETCLEHRVAIIERRMSFEAGPAEFIAEVLNESIEIRQRIVEARRSLNLVAVDSGVIRHAACIATQAHVEGLRADLTIIRTARVIAALDHRSAVNCDDVEKAAPFALMHRRREAPPPSPPAQRSTPPQQSASEPPRSQPSGPQSPPTTSDGCTDPSTESQTAAQPEAVFDIGLPAVIDLERRRKQRRASSGATRLGRQATGQMHIVGTVTEAAQDESNRTSHRPLIVRTAHLRFLTRQRKERRLVVLLVDASGSMAAAARMRAAKGVVCSLLEDAYHRRDMVALIAFRGEKAELLVPPTRSAVFAYRHLRELSTGGRTPLSRGLAQARDVLIQGCRRDPNLFPHLVVISDARANVPQDQAFAHALAEAEKIRKMTPRSLCIDTEYGRVRLGLVRRLADALDAEYRHVETCTERSLGVTIREWMASAA